MSEDRMIAFVGPRARTRVESKVEGVTVKAGVRKAQPKPTVQASGDALRSDERWTAADLQSYVLRKVEEQFGSQPDHSHAPKMAAIFKRFHATWGVDASRIARYAFEGQARPGFWKGAPIKATRFTKANDEFFAKAILDQINL